MKVIVGVESTAHTFGVGVLDMKGGILANVKDSYVTSEGGMVPMEVRAHHARVADNVWTKALKEAGVGEEDVGAIAFSNAPGLAPCLIEGMGFVKSKSRELDLEVVKVNHCVAHLVIGETVGAKDPVMLYASGANTQVVAYGGGKYRVFGETLDLGVGNFLDTIARTMKLGFPGGPKLSELAENYQKKYKFEIGEGECDKSISKDNEILLKKLSKIKDLADKSNIDFWITGSLALLFYSPNKARECMDADLIVKDKKSRDGFVSLLIQNGFEKVNEADLKNGAHPVVLKKGDLEIDIAYSEDKNLLKSDFEGLKRYGDFEFRVISRRYLLLLKEGFVKEGYKVEQNRKDILSLEAEIPELLELPYSVKGMDVSFSGVQTKVRNLIEKGEDFSKLAFAVQETVFAMLVEVAERALAHTGKKELLIGGGVGCNSRLQEMCRKMCEERGVKFFVPERSLLVDNGAMIGYLGLKMYKAGLGTKNLDSVDISPRERMDEVEVEW